MKLIKPTTITDSLFNESNVPETPPAAYAGGTTYALADTVSTGTAGGVITVYESLQNANTGNTPASSPAWWKNIGTTYAAWNSGTTYALGETVLSATTHRVYEAVQGSNTNHNPTTDDGTWWLDIAPTNRWAMLDAVVGTVTSRPDPIVLKVSPGIVNAVALLDVSASNVQVEMVNNLQVVYDQTYEMGDTAILLDWYQYFFDPIVPRDTLVVTDLPPYENAWIRVTINSETTSSCGTIVFGNVVVLGKTRPGAGIGIIDYSKKDTDAFGVTSVIQRSYAKRIEANILVEGTRVDYVAKKLAEVRATPCVWVADGGYDSLVAFGFYNDWAVEIAYPMLSDCRITIEGLA